MRDAAAAAAMSDPDNNRWFRRRWVEIPASAGEPPSGELADIELAGAELLAEWRRERASLAAASAPGP